VSEQTTLIEKLLVDYCRLHNEDEAVKRTVAVTDFKFLNTFLLYIFKAATLTGLDCLFFFNELSGL